MIYFRSIIRRPEVYATLRDVQYLNFVASTYNYRELKADHNTEDYLKFFLKNYSRFIGGDFPEGELPEPEELMAKAMEEEQKLRITSYNVCYTKLLRKDFFKNNNPIILELGCGKVV